MLMGINDLAFLFEILADGPVPDFIASAKTAKISQIDMGHNTLMKLLEDLRQVDPARLNNKMRKRFTILLEELEEGSALAPAREKHQLFKELEEELKGQDFKSIEELQDFVSARDFIHNNRPQPELGGLTPNQLKSLFYRGWWEPDGPVKLSADIQQAEAARVPIVNNVGVMLRSIASRSGRKGLKATCAGNLPRSVINDVIPFLADPGNHDSFHLRSGKKTFNEDDIYCLMMQRSISEITGLLKLNDNHWQVTPEGMALLEPASTATLLTTIFGRMFHKFNLASIDRYPPDPSFQHTLPYSLWYIANLPVDAEYTASELAELVVHPEFLRKLSTPCFPGDKLTLAHRIASSRLFRPLIWAGWLTTIAGKSIFDIDRYRITTMPARLFRTPDLPAPSKRQA